MSWIFGYGSLTWRPSLPVPIADSLCGHIVGFKRRFWQASEDHRGVPSAPGRVVTLVKSPVSDAKVFGVAYRIDIEHVETLMNYLNHREKGGYALMKTEFTPGNKNGCGCGGDMCGSGNSSCCGGLKSFSVQFYVGTRDNPMYVGPPLSAGPTAEVDLDSIAHIIASASGPSGNNSEYMLRLAEFQRNNFPNQPDDHLFMLEKRVIDIVAKNNGAEAQVAVFYGCNVSHRFRIETLPMPEVLGTDELLVRVRLATICASDLHSVSGKRIEPTPGALGHEAVVEVIRSSRPGVVVGQRITFSIINCCVEGGILGEGPCDMCNYGLQQKCQHLFKYGHSLASNASGLNGCYGSHILLRAGTAVVTIPSNVSDRVAAPINCALATMVNAVCEVNSLKGRCSIAVIQGAGILGLYGCALLKDMGFEKIFCIDRNSTRLEMVSSFGGIPVNANATESELPTDGTVDVVIEACGESSVIEFGIRLLRPGGHYIFVGMVYPNSELHGITGEQIIRKCLTIRGVHNYNSDHLVDAVAFIARTADLYPYDMLVSEPYALSELDEAFAVAAQRHFLRVSINPRLKHRGDVAVNHDRILAEPDKGYEIRDEDTKRTCRR